MDSYNLNPEFIPKGDQSKAIDQFNIEAEKPITAYIIFAENKKPQKKPIKIKQDLQNKTILNLNPKDLVPGL